MRDIEDPIQKIAIVITFCTLLLLLFLLFVVGTTTTTANNARVNIRPEGLFIPLKRFIFFYFIASFVPRFEEGKLVAHIKTL